VRLAQQRRLKKRFPLVFRAFDPDRRRRGTPLGERTIECGPGWYALVARLARRLEAQIERLPRTSQRQVFCVQVKEKFGGLRFYMSATTTSMRATIDRATEESFHVCEDCGHPGKPRRRRGWVATLCDDHAKTRLGSTDADAQRNAWFLRSIRPVMKRSAGH
jgi:hypothetical protein